MIDDREEASSGRLPRSGLVQLYLAVIDIETGLDGGGKLRVIACIEDPPLMVKILGHVQRHEVAATLQAQAPPAGSQQTLILT